MEYSIVTLRFFNNFGNLDVEIPLSIAIADLEKRLLEILRSIDYIRFSRVRALNIKYNGMILSSEKTLDDYGIWDGSYLDIIENGGV